MLNTATFRVIDGKRVVTTLVRPLPVRGICEFIGNRTEFRPGCGGNMCRHECDHDEPEPFAVPGGNCQTCTKWEAR